MQPALQTRSDRASAPDAGALDEAAIRTLLAARSDFLEALPVAAAMMSASLNPDAMSAPQPSLTIPRMTAKPTTAMYMAALRINGPRTKSAIAAYLSTTSVKIRASA